MENEPVPVPEKWQHLRPQTIEVLRSRDFHDPRTDRYGAVAPPIKTAQGEVYTSIAYVFKSAKEAADVFSGTKAAYAYPRLSCGTPPIHELSERLLDLELGPDHPEREAYDVVLTSSGMSAITLFVLSQMGEQKEFISSPRIYGGTYNLFDAYLPKLGVQCHWIKNPLDPDEWEHTASLHPEARFLFAEDDANPSPVKLDNPSIANIAHDHNMLYVCDRTIGTPILEKPLLSGTDVIIHSMSKNIGGSSQGLGGAIIARKTITQPIKDGWFVVMGAVMDPRVAAYMLEGIKTLPERMERKMNATAIVADFLKHHPRVKHVHGPGGDLLAFEIEGTIDDARSVVEAYKLINFAPHLGDIQTLSIHPASTTHSRVPPEERSILGISDTLIRLSVGLEDPQDIIDDLRQALAH